MPTGIRPDSVSLLCPKEFELLEPKKEFEDDPGINIGHITVCHNGFVFLLSGFNGYKVTCWQACIRKQLAQSDNHRCLACLHSQLIAHLPVISISHIA